MDLACHPRFLVWEYSDAFIHSDIPNVEQYNVLKAVLKLRESIQVVMVLFVGFVCRLKGCMLG